MIESKVLESLEAKQKELRDRISAIENDFKKGRSPDFAEQTTESENDQVLDEIHQEAKNELRLVNQALQSLKQDQYGICSECDQPISVERLHVLPYTNTCIKCAS
ncbi:TraR/DksA family transcriptional regulator [Colwelliaceae bacterium 6471]